jgi:phosphoglycerate dehydrogenase-like enzyme
VDGLCVDALPAGCTVCNVYEHEVPIAEYVMLNMLLLASRQIEHERAFRAGNWLGSGRFNGTFHDELAGATLGLVGYGHIGREVAKRAKAFDMRVTAIRRAGSIDDGLLDWTGTREQLDELLATADYVVIACPLSPETRGMIGERELRRMKPSAFLINPSRAHICDEQALFDALNDRTIRGAALDVWYPYPDTIEQNMRGSQLPFHELENVIVTPHLSAWTEAMMQRRFARIAENLDRFARGGPLVSVVHRRA